MNTIILSFTVLIISLTNTPRFNYSYQKFSLTWPASFCQRGNCRHGWDNWDGRSFVVHGLWPSSNDEGFMRQMRTGDQTCQSNVRYNTTALPQLVQAKLVKIMPGLTKNPRQFWRYEYEKHGSCNVLLAQNNGASLPGNQLMVNYFHRFRLTKSQYKGTNQLAQALGLKPSTFVARVQKGNLVQLQICLAPSRIGAAAQPQFIDCPNNQQIKSMINLPGLRTNYMRHLTRYQQTYQ